MCLVVARYAIEAAEEEDEVRVRVHVRVHLECSRVCCCNVICELCHVCVYIHVLLLDVLCVSVVYVLPVRLFEVISARCRATTVPAPAARGELTVVGCLCTV
jgi:hypothetical protein